ncbi:hypothetical protein G3567_12895 [Psychroflexus sp. YR1-1]|uniref:YcxB-like protein n=1 Tax=Psychroflexus aurantiacus TaxID=2709310 RepID=A0A6B3RBY1_9FLAO|nr:hypothetical protein [Psychroflexus aurantiacus]NEV95034.1 hypothetical protein [Psychroflexus aurantiacus]
MEITIFQKFKNYKRDCIKYFIYDTFDSFFKAFILIYLIILLIGLLNFIDELNFYPDIINMLIPSLGIGLLGMLIYSTFFLIRAVIKINKERKSLFEGEMHLSFSSEEINFLYDGNTYSFNLNEIKELKVIYGTAFFISIKNDILLRINHKEITNGSFLKLIEFIQAKWKR